MASLYRRKDSQFFWVKYRNKSGELCQQSTGCKTSLASDVRRARQIEAEKSLEEIKNGNTHKLNSGWEWATTYLRTRYSASNITLVRYEQAWVNMLAYIREKEIVEPAAFTRQHCFDYVNWRKTPNKTMGRYKAGQSTSLTEISVLSIVMQEAIERGMINGNPCTKLKIRREKRKEKPELTAEHCARIRAEIVKWKKPAEKQMLEISFEIARYQGCRLAETRLNPFTDVILEDNSGRIMFKAKGGREFWTMLHPKLVPLINRLRAENRQSSWDIPEHCKLRWHWAGSVWWQFLKKAGLKKEGITFHSTRVTVVTELARSNVPESKAKSYVGHSSTTVHRIYQRLRPNDLSDCPDAIG